MASNPTMEAFEHALTHTLYKESQQRQSSPAPEDDISPAQRSKSRNSDLLTFSSPRQQSPAPAQQQQQPAMQPFIFAGALPTVQPPKHDFFSGQNVLDLLSSSAAFVLQPCLDLPRPWDYILVGTYSGNALYKRAGIATSRVPAKRITDDATVERELFAAQMAPRKRMRTSWAQPQLGVNQSLFDTRALRHFRPKAVADDVKIAVDAISSHYAWLAKGNLEYPLDIKNHTWTGSLEYEVMTILPRKRLSNREFKIRLEERIYGVIFGGAPDAQVAPSRKIARSRHRRTVAQCPDLSTISECTEPASSPVRPRTKLAPLNSSPAKLLLAPQFKSTPRRSLSPRKALSPFEFSFSSPSPANGTATPTPTRSFSLVKSAAMWRTPDIFASTPKTVALSCSPPRRAPLSPSIAFDKSAVEYSAANSRRSSTGSSRRAARRSLTTSRLLAISDLAQSPAAPRVSFGTLDQNATLCQSSDGDVTMMTAPLLQEESVHATLSIAEDSIPPASNPIEPNLATPNRGFVSSTDAEAGTAAPAIAEADFVEPANAEASFATPTFDNDDNTKTIKISEQPSIHVDLRTNLDIFGSHRDAPASMAQMDDVDAVEDSSPSPEKEPSKDEDEADDEFTSVINHNNINDTISLNLGAAQASPGMPENVVAGKGEDADEDREELQQFLNRHWAQGKTSVKPKRRSGSLGLATSITGSPMPRNEMTSDNETMAKRMPLGAKDPNMSPSPIKKRKAADSDDELSGGKSLLEAPALDDHSPPRPKRRRRNVEADSDGVLNPVFQQQTRQGEPRELRRSTRATARRTLVTAGPSANSTAMSKVPVRLPGSLVGDGADSSFGSSLSAARSEERRLAATTRGNTRRNRGGSLPAGEVLALKAKQKTPPTGDESGDEAPRAKKRTTKMGMTKSVRWDSVLARYQDEALASSDAPGATGPQGSVSRVDDDDDDELADAPDVGTRKATPVARRTTSRISRLQPPTPVKKTTSAPSGPPAPGVAAGRVKKLAAPAAPVVARRTSAQLAAASAAKKIAAAAAVAAAATPVAAPAARRTRIATPAAKKRATKA
ncbi:hypothetical protein RB600_003623 [Gaeumannomyces tritici]